MVVLTLLRVLGLETINLTGLGAELRPENVDTPLKDPCPSCQLALRSLQLVLRNYGSGVSLYRHCGTARSSTYTVPLLVAATD